MADTIHHAHATIDIAGRGTVAIEVTSINYGLAHDVAAAIDRQGDLIHCVMTCRCDQGEASRLRSELAQVREQLAGAQALIIAQDEQTKRVMAQRDEALAARDRWIEKSDAAGRARDIAEHKRDQAQARAGVDWHSLIVALRRIAAESSCQGDDSRAERCQDIARAALRWADQQPPRHEPVQPDASVTVVALPTGMRVGEIHVVPGLGTLQLVAGAAGVAPYIPTASPAPAWTFAQVIEHLRQIADPDMVSPFHSCLWLDQHAKPRPIDGVTWTAEVRRLLAQIDAGAVIEALPEPVAAELRRARERFPSWPTDPLHALAVLQEEVGELTKAVTQEVYEPHKQSRVAVRREAIQTAAMALRFLGSLAAYSYTPSAQHQITAGA